MEPHNEPYKYGSRVRIKIQEISMRGAIIKKEMVSNRYRFGIEVSVSKVSVSVASCMVIEHFSFLCIGICIGIDILHIDGIGINLISVISTTYLVPT